MRHVDLVTLLRVYDNGPGTMRKLKVTPGPIERLEAMGMVRRIIRKALTFERVPVTLVSITARGIRECKMSGKRFGLHVTEIPYRKRTAVK